MEGIQGELFDPGEHEHVWTRSQGPYVTATEITLPSGSKWCWTCASWVSLYRNGAWLNWQQKQSAGFTWRDEIRHGGA